MHIIANIFDAFLQACQLDTQCLHLLLTITGFPLRSRSSCKGCEPLCDFQSNVWLLSKDHADIIATSMQLTKHRRSPATPRSTGQTLQQK